MINTVSMLSSQSTMGIQQTALQLRWTRTAAHFLDPSGIRVMSLRGGGNPQVSIQS